MTRVQDARGGEPVDASKSVAVGWLGLMLPFSVVFIAAVALGDRTPGEIVATASLLLVPIAILLLRRRAARNA